MYIFIQKSLLSSAKTYNLIIFRILNEKLIATIKILITEPFNLQVSFEIEGELIKNELIQQKNKRKKYE